MKKYIITYISIMLIFVITIVLILRTIIYNLESDSNHYTENDNIEECLQIQNHKYYNYYYDTSFGFPMTNFCVQDTKINTKSTEFKNAYCEGQCASGELVCLYGYSAPEWFVANKFRILYTLSNPKLPIDSYDMVLYYYDISSNQVVYSIFIDSDKETDNRSKMIDKYLSMTLEEAQNEKD